MPETTTSTINSITVEELKTLIDTKANFQLIDVREKNEKALADIGGELIPLSTIASAADRISKDKPVVVYCRSGARSRNAIAELQQNFGFTNLRNLNGGILAWADRHRSGIDTLMVTPAPQA